MSNGVPVKRELEFEVTVTDWSRIKLKESHVAREPYSCAATFHVEIQSSIVKDGIKRRTSTTIDRFNQFHSTIFYSEIVATINHLQLHVVHNASAHRRFSQSCRLRFCSA